MSGHKLLIYVMGLFMLLGASAALAAGDNSGQPTGKTSTNPFADVEIFHVDGSLRHGKQIRVELMGIDKNKIAAQGLAKYTLLMDGIKIMDGPRMLCDGTLVFDIDNDKVEPDTWGKISRCVSSKGSLFITKAQVEISHGDWPRISGNNLFELRYLEPWELWTFLGVYALLLIGFFYAAGTSALIRDPSRQVAKVRKRPFSLGKSQMAFWFVIVLPCFFFIWMISGSLNSLSEQTLILLGISSMTTLVAGYVGKNKADKKEAELPVLEEEKGQLEAKLLRINKELESAAPELKAVLLGQERAANERLAQIKSALPPEPQPAEERSDQAGVPVAPPSGQAEKEVNPAETQGFIKDILRDASGINIHRLQCVIWTLVLGYIFISDTICTLAMPNLSATLLTLLGISNGTYLALKVPEK